MADQGASQRRGTQNTSNTPIGETSTLFPKSSSSETLPQLSFGPPSGHDIGSSEYRGYYDPNITEVNTSGLFEDPSGQGSRSQRMSPLLQGNHDLPSAPRDYKQVLHTPTGITSPALVESPNTATSEEGADFAGTSLIQQPPTTYYKLCAYDSILTTVSTRWVSIHKDLTDAPASNGSGVLMLASITIEASWTQ